MPDPVHYSEAAAVVEKNSDSVRVYTNSAIPRFIDERHGDAETRFREMSCACFRNGGGGND